jgi:pilus assembly protein CpaF
MRNAGLFFEQGQNKKKFTEILEELQEYITLNYADAISDEVEKMKVQLPAYIEKYITDKSLAVEGLNTKELIKKLYSEMAEFSFLSKYLGRNDVEEININSWRDIKVTYTNGDTIPTEEKFTSPEHALNVMRRLLHRSGMIIDNSQPAVRGHLSNKIRITVLGTGVIDKKSGIAASIRIVNPQKLAKEDFINNGTATVEMLDLLSTLLRFGISMCSTGATGSGKTTIMSWLMSTLPYDKRIYTIENDVREFDLEVVDEKGNVLNNVVHTITRVSDDPKQSIDSEKLLEMALTFDPDYICVAEMKGPESFAAQEAARTGHAVITTTHANSCDATHYRMVTLCKMKYNMDDDTLYSLVTEAFPIVFFTKKNEDKKRRIMEIKECEILAKGKREMRTLYRFRTENTTTINNKTKIDGYFEKVNDISDSLKRRLLENGMPIKELNRFLTNKLYDGNNGGGEGETA